MVRVFAVLACLGGVACTTDDTAVGVIPLDATVPFDAHVNGLDASGADASAADATDAKTVSPFPGFDASGLDAAGLDSSAAIGCVGTGGVIGTSSCCIQAGSFPDTCSIGACSCSPAFSTPTMVCQCPAGKCWGASVQLCVVWDGGLTPP